MKIARSNLLIALAFVALIAPEPWAFPAGPNPVDGCGDVSIEGQCDGDELTWCENGEVVVADCAAIGATCGWDASQSFYDCLSAENGCGMESFEGRCDGDTVVWCEDQSVFEADCSELGDAPGLMCGFSCEFEVYDCLDPSDHVASPQACDSSLSEADASSTSTDSAQSPGDSEPVSGGCAGAASPMSTGSLLVPLMFALWAVRRRPLNSA